jgi:hypothetical protein
MWTDVLQVEEPGAEVVATYGGGTYLDGRPAVVRRGGLVYAGFSHRDSWLELLSSLTGRTPAAEGVEVFERGGATFVIDHDQLTVSVTQGRR